MNRALAGLALALAAAPAAARTHAGPVAMDGGRRLQGVIAPLDGGGSFSTPAAAYGLRRLKSTYAGPAIRLRRASDNAEQDINFLGFTGFTGAPLDVAAANAFCAATTCWGVTAYDQSGNARHATQGNVSFQPQLIFNCLGTLPCFRSTVNGNRRFLTASEAWAVKTSSSVVANRPTATTSCTWTGSGNAFATDAVTANSWLTTAFISGGAYGTAADGVWHAGIGIIDGAASLVRIDGTDGTPSATTGSSVAGALGVFAGGTPNCDMVEGIVWDGYALTPGERAALQTNQKSFWGTP